VDNHSFFWSYMRYPLIKEELRQALYGLIVWKKSSFLLQLLCM
jgi:hypothetical protein